MKPTILLVDDELEIRGLLKEIFEDFLGARVLVAENGEEGLNVLKSDDKIHLVISDLAMPKMNGFEFIRRARQQGYKVPIMVLTGHGDLVVAQQLKGFGVQDFINKPWDNKKLLEVVQNNLAKSALAKKVG